VPGFFSIDVSGEGDILEAFPSMLLIASRGAQAGRAAGEFEPPGRRPRSCRLVIALYRTCWVGGDRHRNAETVRGGKGGFSGHMRCHVRWIAARSGELVSNGLGCIDGD